MLREDALLHLIQFSRVALKLVAIMNGVSVKIIFANSESTLLCEKRVQACERHSCFEKKVVRSAQLTTPALR